MESPKFGKIGAWRNVLNIFKNENFEIVKSFDTNFDMG